MVRGRGYLGKGQRQECAGCVPREEPPDLAGALDVRNSGSRPPRLGCRPTESLPQPRHAAQGAS